MAITSMQSPQVSNRLLATLKPDAFTRVVGKLVPTALTVKQVLYRPGEHIREVYFPDDAVIVLLAVDVRGSHD